MFFSSDFRHFLSLCLCNRYPYRWLVCRSCDGFGHINKIKLRRTRLVLRLVITFGGSTIPVFNQAHSACPFIRGYWEGCNEYWRWFWPPLWKKRRVVRSSRPCSIRNGGVYCMLTYWVWTSPAQRSNGMSSLATDLCRNLFIIQHGDVIVLWGRRCLTLVSCVVDACAIQHGWRLD